MKSKKKKAKDSAGKLEIRQSCFYYMVSKSIKAGDIFDVIKKNSKFDDKTEFWDEADVLEIQTGEKTSIDIEKIDIFKDEEDRKFVNDNKIGTIFSIVAAEQDFECVVEVFREVVKSIGGFVCSDTKDFMPYIVSEREG